MPTFFAWYVVQEGVPLNVTFHCETFRSEQSGDIFPAWNETLHREMFRIGHSR